MAALLHSRVGGGNLLPQLLAVVGQHGSKQMLGVGQDMGGAYGSPVYSTADGIVVTAGWDGGYGREVKVQNAFGIETLYGHLSQIRVQPGQRVSRGDRIGDMGSTGRSTGTHLHYEIRVGGKAVNPMTYIKAATNVF